MGTIKDITIRSIVTIAVASPLALCAQVQGPGGNYYGLIVDPGITWARANDLANVLSFQGCPGHLVTITSSAEDAFVLGMITDWQQAQLASQPQSFWASEFWAGGFQAPDELVATEGWTWVNGEGSFPGANGQAVYANWSGGQPDDYPSPGNEQYLGLGLLDFISPPTWNDEGNPRIIAGFVVEYECESVPEQGALTWCAALTLGGLVLLGTRKFERGSTRAKC